ncbi:MAG: MBL fold metallo-hydrolase [Deltaproteobacteria bacterium]|nr:MBL fold metallo-hydrolase [Deltaproteobacteria bacterium]
MQHDEHCQPLHAPLHLGRYDAQVIQAGRFALDGGAMFGVIPRTMWEKRIEPDARHRIDLATNCLLLRDGKRVILVDNGMGNKWNAKEQGIFKIGEWTLLENLQKAGVAADDVTDLFLTHLHFDHAGGSTALDENEELRITFANANVHVGKRNWEWAKDPVERDRGSYRRENFELLNEGGRLVLHDDEKCLAEGAAPIRIFDDFEAFSCDGHTSGQLLPLVGPVGANNDVMRLLYGADMIPTQHHVRMPWHMGYDLRPTTLLKEKRALLSLCSDEHVALLFEHDLQTAVASIVREGKDFSVNTPLRSPLG